MFLLGQKKGLWKVKPSHDIGAVDNQAALEVKVLIGLAVVEREDIVA